ncbi:hypothetical protein EYC84_011536 [Monilinia fructicola]|uniref:Uncharacterized protein n=1 Tax=Monilinia fructicola TaxID=38448 RepID=A0A5M9JBG6_MONFR|nr:hypothetical protein EYC84_011536 [Monilinia fructicola]
MSLAQGKRSRKVSKLARRRIDSTRTGLLPKNLAREQKRCKILGSSNMFAVSIPACSTPVVPNTFVVAFTLSRVLVARNE